MPARNLVVISYYDQRPIDTLLALLNQTLSISAGANFDLCVVVNAENVTPTMLPERHKAVQVLHRENGGFNVGAWQHGWKSNPHYDFYLFLQDECVIRLPGWLTVIARAATRNPKVGFVGEGIDCYESWETFERCWPPIAEEIYKMAADQGITLSTRPDYVQTLIVGARRDVLEQTGGFVVGDGKISACAGEILTSVRARARADYGTFRLHGALSNTSDTRSGTISGPHQQDGDGRSPGQCTYTCPRHSIGWSLAASAARRPISTSPAQRTDHWSMSKDSKTALGNGHPARNRYSVTTAAAAAANPQSAKLAEYALFDVLRFLLAAAVMLWHMGVLRWINAGNLAVQVFFALSGWLIGSILCRTKAGELSRFYFNRATRIWIPYFASVTTLYVVSLIHEPVLSSRWHEFLIYDVTFTHNWFSLWPNAQLALSEMPLHGTGNHFWSISVEEQFYLAAPLFVTLLPFGRRILPWMVISATALLAQSQYTSVSLGVLSAVLANHYFGWFLTFRARIALVAAATVCALLFIIPSLYNFAAPIFSVSVVLLCAVPSGRNAVTQWLGGVSFPFYLNAWVGTFALHALVKHFAIPEGWYSMPLEFLSGLCAAAVSYHLIDRKVMRTRNKYYVPHLGWMLGGAAYVLLTLGVAYWLI